jgi:transglutaminase-like putative cysteine protease
MIPTQVKTVATSFWLYSFSFLLIWEWLRPLEQLTNTSNISVFLFFVGMSFLLYLIKVGFWIRLFVKSIYLLITLHSLYFDEPLFSFTWVDPLIRDMAQNIALVFRANWPDLTNVFRSFLFFLLLGIMTYLLRYWVIVKRKIFIFFLMTIIYITVLDTFSTYSANYAIVRTVIIGFVMMGLLSFYRQIERTGIRIENTATRNWVVTLLGFILVSVAIGFSIPKADPVWADPVPYLKSYSDKAGGINKAGYGTDDTKLGGAFIGDNRTVFRAEVESRHYWKVETKDVYTGKGWITSESAPTMIPFKQNEVVPVSTFADGVETVQEKATITQTLKYDHIVYPSGLKGILASPTTTFEMNPITEKIVSLNNIKQISLDEYQLVYEVPKYSVKALLGSSDVDPVIENDLFMQQYTQLPDSLPPRVRELALEITAGKNTWYDQAVAIEGYFDRPEYFYEKTDVLIPGEKDDYVDQFLFDSKRGYCDNFSSSMVVMLRTLGIPTRWVKGYTEGDFKRLGEKGKRVFEITNNNAHSWVEVYFKNVGWVPFEPTKGFTNNVQFNYDVDSTQPSATVPIVKKPTVDKTPIQEKEDGSSAFSLKEIWNWSKNVVSQQLKWIVAMLVVILAIVFITYRSRLKWLPYFLIWKYKLGKQDKHFTQAYLDLLKQFDRSGLKRKENQTLRDYARYIDHNYRTREMGLLTSRYEQFMYKGSLPEGSWRELKELWEKLIKKTIA